MLKAKRQTEIPEMTQLVAKSVFPNGNMFLTLRDELGLIFEDKEFADLYSAAEAPAGDYPVIATVIETQSGQTVGPAVTLATVSVEPHERNFELPKNVTPLSAFLNGQFELVGYKLHNQTVAPRDSFGLTLYWRSLHLAETSYTVFVHAIGPDASLRGQWDSLPVQGNAPTTGWLPGEIIEDHYQIPMAKDAPAWKYDIFVGMYDSLTGKRLTAASQTAPTSDNRIWLTRVQVVDPE